MGSIELVFLFFDLYVSHTREPEKCDPGALGLDARPDQDPYDPGYNSSNCDEECPIKLGVPHILPEDKKGLDRLGPRLGFLDSH